MNNIEKNILKKSGWKNEQLNFLGTIVYNVESSSGESIDVVLSKRNAEQITLELFVPNKDGDRMGLFYSLFDKKLVKSDTDQEINTEENISEFLETIESVITGSKACFFHEKKIVLENNNKPYLS